MSWREDLESLLVGVGLQAGDVVLTGSADPISWLIQLSLQSNISHSLLMLDRIAAIEANDGIHHPRLQKATLGDQFGRVGVVTVGDLCHTRDLNTVVIRRPAFEIDARALNDVAFRYGTLDAPFGGSALVLAGCLILVDGRIGAALFGDEQSTVVQQLAGRLADGPASVICAELVDRCLRESGHELGIPFPQLLTAMEQLGPHLADQSQVPMTSAPSGLEALVAGLPGRWNLFGQVKFAIDNLRVGLGERLEHFAQGDRSDLLVPSDFLTAEPMTTLLAVQRNEDRWTDFSVAADV